MIILKKILFIAIFFLVFFPVSAQENAAPKMHDIFLEFISKKLLLNAQESRQMRPLVIRYFNETRKINRDGTDKLLREQQKIDLKIRYTNLFIPIIDIDRSNQFFTEK